MRKSVRRTPNESPWVKTTWQVPPPLYRALKVRAAQEGREIRAVLAAALRAYLATPVREAS